jgi:hypothetical protein
MEVSATHYADLARHAIQPVLDGAAPNGTKPEDCGPWATVVDGVFKGYYSGGKDRARKVFNTLAAADQGIVKMMAGADQGARGAQPHLINAVALVEKIFAPINWVVPEILPEGVFLFAGKPKMGKSWLAFNLAIAVACGGRALGTIKVIQGSVLYLALEDNERRLQSRMIKLLQGGATPSRLDLAIEWQRMGDDALGITWLAGWIEAHPDARLIVIDTLAKVRPPIGKSSSIYDHDYATVQGLKGIADRYHVAILIVHHVRKGVSDDPLELISGSFGLSGGVDGTIVLARDRGQADAVLHITGRDVEEKELAMTWGADLALWTIAGDAEEFRTSKERKAIIDVVRQMGIASPKDVAEALDKPAGGVKKLLRDMLEDGQIEQAAYGKYKVSP